MPSFEVTRLQFSLYRKDELESISAIEINVPQSFDHLEHPMPGGLYDLHMGPLTQKQVCSTCSLNISGCPGHFGHIRLHKVVYNPLLFTLLYQVLKSTCFKCKRFKLNQQERKELIRKLLVLRSGKYFASDDFNTKNGNASFDKIQDSRGTEACISGTKPGENNASDGCYYDQANDAEKTRSSLEGSDTGGSYTTFLHHEHLSKIIEQSCKARCPLCNNRNPKLVRGRNMRIVRDERQTDASCYKFFTPEEAFVVIQGLFIEDSAITDLIFSTRDHGIFFLSHIAISPNKFRPIQNLNEKRYENPQNILLSKIISTNLAFSKNPVFWSELQANVLSYYDSAQNPRSKIPGHKQLLEKKDGLFRKNIMGKRVNFAARSVISPDPNLETREIGIPLIFAQKLTFPEPVTAFNLDRLRKAVINGTVYPGCTKIECDGVVTDVKYISEEKRLVLANSLLSGRKIVSRHLMDGDTVLVNRQPTLHKPSIMGHKVRVLKGEKTLRMHYVNCKPYNADFDGDEMNIHFPQTYASQAETSLLAMNDVNYLVSTNGGPIRGLTEDHVVAASIITLKDTFFTKHEYMSLLNAGISNFRFKLDKPCVSKPIKLYSGKQIVSTILKNLGININLNINTKISKASWGDHEEEAWAVFSNGEMVTGILDKNTIGPTSKSLIHASGELFRSKAALFDNVRNLNGVEANAYANGLNKTSANASSIHSGLQDKTSAEINSYKLLDYKICNDLLTIISRVVNRFLITYGFTVRIDDLLLKPQANLQRRLISIRGNMQAQELCTRFINKNRDFYHDQVKVSELDAIIREKMNEVTSSIVAVSVPDGLMKKFPRNNMGLIVSTGAKGTIVNMSQISGSLGQQELEGKRVPVMASGKSLPCFMKLDSSPSAGGYIFQRFLTGIDPSEYFFHCMAGREGLIDTAVKTANSGYLQRSLIKHLEGVKVEYDMSVRIEKNIIQYKYGEDGIDCTKATYLDDFDFYRKNLLAYRNPKCGSLSCRKLQRSAAKLNPDEGNNLTDSCDDSESWNADTGFGSFTSSLMQTTPLVSSLFREKIKNLSKVLMRFLLHKYEQSLVDPGDSVGIIAAQSIGEPSTQMTLNTFHLAGIGSKNVTLGIPRLREIIMVAAKNIKTPLITVPFKGEAVQALASILKKVTLADCVEKIAVTESIVSRNGIFEKKIWVDFKIDKFRNATVKALDRKLLERLNYKLKRISGFRGIVTNTVNVSESGKMKDNLDEIGSEKSVDEESEDCVSSSDGYGSDDGSLSVKEDDKQDDSTNCMNEMDDIDKAADLLDQDYKIHKSEETFLDKSEDDLKRNSTQLLNFMRVGKNTYRYEAYFKPTFSTSLIPLIDSLLPTITVKEYPGIHKATVNRSTLLLEGSSFKTLTLLVRNIDLLEVLDFQNSYSNDIYAVLQNFGVEAARQVIVSEVISVFNAYGINIDLRHLLLIADYMTRNGEYSPFSRTGLKESNSPLQKMSFESCYAYIKNACVFKDSDRLSNPSACLVVGTPVKAGTGAFDLYYDMHANCL